MNKQLCIQTILTLVMAVGAVSVGFTTFVQTEIKDDVKLIRNENLIDREKISSLQVQLGEIKGDIKVLLERTNGQPEKKEIFLNTEG